jgi:hypothetical protein
VNVRNPKKIATTCENPNVENQAKPAKTGCKVVSSWFSLGFHQRTLRVDYINLETGENQFEGNLVKLQKVETGRNRPKPAEPKLKAGVDIS